MPVARDQEGGIERGRALEPLHDFLPLLDNAHNGVAGLAAGALLSSSNTVSSRATCSSAFGPMLLEGAFKLLGVSGPGHFWQGDESILFREINVFQRFMEEFAKIFVSHRFGTVPNSR